MSKTTEVLKGWFYVYGDLHLGVSRVYRLKDPIYGVGPLRLSLSTNRHLRDFDFLFRNRVHSDMSHDALPLSLVCRSKDQRSLDVREPLLFCCLLSSSVFVTPH